MHYLAYKYEKKEKLCKELAEDSTSFTIWPNEGCNITPSLIVLMDISESPSKQEQM